MMDLAGTQGLKRSPSRVWMELGRLSGKGDDLGVGGFLNTIGFLPSAVALLTCCPDFVHEHDGVIDETPLRWEYSSYNGWRRTRRWTRREYRSVVRHFQARGIKVFLSCMATAYHPAFEKMSDWAGEHSELFLIHRTGLHGFTDEGLFAGMRYYHIAGRFKDGRYYEDYFADQVRRTVVDYGFDGFHAADGYKSFILGIMAACFSPDMLDQFEQQSGIVLPRYKDGDLIQTMPAISRWIWKNHRLEWIGFWRQRFVVGWGKVASALKSEGKEFSINSAWCTDPLESITRYGMDTRALEAASAESMFFETMDIYTLIGPVSGPRSHRREGYVLEGHESHPGSLMAALLRGVHTPGMRLYPMIHVHDQFERFEFLKSGRSYLERAIVNYQQLYRLRSGKLEPAAAGVWYALPGDVSMEDWKFLRTADELTRLICPGRIPGPVALWSASALENEIEPSRRRWSVHRTISELVGAGCPIITSATCDELGGLSGEVLVWANPGSFSEDEQRRVWEWASSQANRLVIFDSTGETVLPAEVAALEIVDRMSGAKLAVTGSDQQIKEAEAWLSEEAELMLSKGLLRRVDLQGRRAAILPARKPRPFEYRDDMEEHFMTRVPPTRLAGAYLELAAEIARRVSWPLLPEIRVNVGPREGELPGCENSLFYIVDRRGSVYLFAGNLHRYASYLRMTWARRVAKSEQLNLVLFHPDPVGNVIEVMIPAWGVTIYEVRLADD